jgi:acyl carrier protein
MTGHLGDAELARLSRAGGAPLTVGEGLALFDAAWDLDQPALVPIKLDLAELRARAGSEPVPPLLRGLIRVAVRRVHAPTDVEKPASWSARLVGLTAAARQETLLDLVRSQAATVLGHTRPDAVSGDRAFGDLGFDSLTVVELRNRLNAMTGLRLPATLLFRYPTPATLAEYLSAELPDGPS